MGSAALALRHASILYHFADKNSQARQIVRDYAAKHAVMDIGVGLVSLIPGAGIPAIIAAIAIQSDVIYKPMARDLADVYLRETDSYTDRLGNTASMATVALEFGEEFAVEFLAEQTKELLTEAGLGALATTIPIAGAAVGAALDYLIAQMMTWRVGTMTAIYFLNGTAWVENRKSTMKIAERLTGGLQVGVRELMSPSGRDRVRAKEVRVEFDRIPSDVPEVKQSSVQTLVTLIKGFADKLPRPAVKDSLLQMGLPDTIVDAALDTYYC